MDWLTEWPTQVTEQTTKWMANQPTDEPSNVMADQPTDEPSNVMADQPADQPAGWLAIKLNDYLSDVLSDWLTN